MSKITYEDKVNLNVDSDVADINKVRAEDLNEVKTVVNANDDLRANLTTIVNGLKGELLWSNPNPSSNFEAQNVTLSSDDYDVLEIFYYDYRANARMLSTRVKKGQNCNLCSVFLTEGEVYMSTREMDYVSDTQYSLNNCSSVKNTIIGTLNSSSPAQCIPIYIVGYTTGIFD